MLDELVGEKGSGQYVWTTQWYPVRVAEDLHTDRPNALKLLGKDLVIWRDAQSQWRCFEDACPHRYVSVIASHTTTTAVTDHLPMFSCLGVLLPRACVKLLCAAFHPRPRDVQLGPSLQDYVYIISSASSPKAGWAGYLQVFLISLLLMLQVCHAVRRQD